MKRRLDSKIEALLKRGVFASANKRELARVSRLLDELTFEPGDVLPDALPGSGSTYIVLDGLVEMSIDGQPIWTSSTGNLVGDLGLLPDRPAMVATAITEVRVLEVAPGAQRQLCGLPSVVEWLTAELGTLSWPSLQPRPI
jgi:hypothetical protein